ncbi:MULTISPECIES: hypothetical protein [unclassified Wolbachia]
MFIRKVSFQRVTLESQKKDDVIRVADTGMTGEGGYFHDTIIK